MAVCNRGREGFFGFRVVFGAELREGEVVVQGGRIRISVLDGGKEFFRGFVIFELGGKLPSLESCLGSCWERGERPQGVPRFLCFTQVVVGTCERGDRFRLLLDEWENLGEQLGGTLVISQVLRNHSQ